MSWAALRQASSKSKAKKTWTERARKKGFDEGVNKGYQRGLADYKITYECSICDQEIIMRPNSNDHQAMKDMIKQAGWAYSSCLEKKK
jgi:hypothetical protein